MARKNKKQRLKYPPIKITKDTIEALEQADRGEVYTIDSLDDFFAGLERESDGTSKSL